MAREYIKGTWQESRSFSPAVVTRGGRHIWLAGVTAGKAKGEKGKHPLAGNFEAQVHSVFHNMGETLERVGGRLQDIVTMTVFISDVRYGDQFCEIRKQYFPEGFPASTLITVSGFAVPVIMVEITATAVVGEE